MRDFARLAGAICAVFALLWLGGCKLPAPDPEIDAAGRLAYRQMAAGDFAAFLSNATPELEAKATPSELAKVRSYIPGPAPAKGRLVLWQVMYPDASAGAATASLTYEYDYPGKVARAEIRLTRTAAKAPWLTDGFHVQLATTAELAATKFTLKGKPFANYAVLAALILEIGLILGAIAAVVMAPKFRWKWLWALLPLITVCKFSFDWFSAQWGFQPLSIQLLGIGVIKHGGQFSPWLVNFSLPMGAAIALWRALKARRQAKASEPALADSKSD